MSSNLVSEILSATRLGNNIHNQPVHVQHQYTKIHVNISPDI